MPSFTLVGPNGCARGDAVWPSPASFGGSSNVAPAYLNYRRCGFTREIDAEASKRHSLYYICIPQVSPMPPAGLIYQQTVPFSLSLSLLSLLSHDKDRFGAVNLLFAKEPPEARGDGIGRVHAA